MSKHWIRADKFGEAELVEWRRLAENRDLQQDIHILQSRFGLPLVSYSEPLFFSDAYVSWMGQRDSLNDLDDAIETEKDKRRNKLWSNAWQLLDKYNIPKQYFGSLWALLMTGDYEREWGYLTKGFARFKYARNGSGEWAHECIITPETDLSNPLVLNNIKEWQAKHKVKPPMPIRIGKTTDWRPLWEWRNRNPDVSDREIATILGFNRVTVSRAFENLDKQFATKFD